MSGLQVYALKKAYDGRAVLDGVSLSAGAGEIVAIMGPSGGGKTTLLRCILGFAEPDGGTIKLAGRSLAGVPLEERQIGYMPQSYGLFPHLSVRDNVAFGLTVRGVSKGQAFHIVNGLLDAVELPHEFADHSVEHLSGGEQQRVALARALAIEPKLFLLDEPLSAIDEDMRVSIGTQLRDIIKRSGIPAVIISHDRSDAQLIGDRIYRLEGGNLFPYGS